MKHKASSPHSQVSQKCHHENRVMSMFQTASDSFDAKIHEEKVCQRVDNFRGVYSRIIVLRVRSVPIQHMQQRYCVPYLLAPVYCTCLGIPKALLGTRIVNGGQPSSARF